MVIVTGYDMPDEELTSSETGRGLPDAMSIAKSILLTSSNKWKKSVA